MYHSFSIKEALHFVQGVSVFQVFLEINGNYLLHSINPLVFGISTQCTESKVRFVVSTHLY